VARRIPAGLVYGKRVAEHASQQEKQKMSELDLTVIAVPGRKAVTPRSIAAEKAAATARSR
jgi:hypothetical protein